MCLELRNTKIIIISLHNTRTKHSNPERFCPDAQAHKGFHTVFYSLLFSPLFLPCVLIHQDQARILGKNVTDLLVFKRRRRAPPGVSGNIQPPPPPDIVLKFESWKRHSLYFGVISYSERILLSSFLLG